MDTRLARRARSREEKIAIARRWQSSGKTQEDFCRTEGIASRTLRGYLALVPEVSWDRQLKESVTRAIDALTTIVKALEHQPVMAGVEGPAPVPKPVAPAMSNKLPTAASAMTGHHAGFVFRR